MKEELTIAYQEVFNTPQGKKVLDDLDARCRYHRNAFNPQSERITSYNLGCLWVVQHIHNVIDRNLFEEPKDEVVNTGVSL